MAARRGPVATATRTLLSPSRSIRSSKVGCAGFARLLSAAAASLYALATPAQAHGFGQRYDLPLPLTLYVTGACVAIVVTFLVVGLFFRAAPRPHASPPSASIAPALVHLS